MNTCRCRLCSLGIFWYRGVSPVVIATGCKDIMVAHESQSSMVELVAALCWVCTALSMKAATISEIQDAGSTLKRDIRMIPHHKQLVPF